MPDGDSGLRAGGDVIFRIDDGTAIVRLNRPAKRNALSQAMWEAICAALAEAAARPEVRAFVFTGLPGVFCAGADLSALKSGDRGSGRASHLLCTAGRVDAARAAAAGLVDILADDLDAEPADFLGALRAADVPTLLAIRETIRQVR